jgi:hypothetical protein
LAINKLYISHEKYNWDRHPSELLTKKNIRDAMSSDELIDYHTSINDISGSNLHSIFVNARGVQLVDLDSKFINNIDSTDNNYWFSYGTMFNELSKISDKVENFEWIDRFNFNTPDFNFLYTQRSTQKPVLWTVGCSVTYGHGITTDQRWGKLLAESLELPEVSLSYPGTSLAWAADQILRSDIKKDDVVVLGITSLARLDYAENWQLNSLPACQYEKVKKELHYWSLEYFDSPTHIMLSTRHILQIINFCNKVGAKVVIANLLDMTWMPTIFRNCENFIDLTQGLLITDSLKFIDMGDDNIHPGPKQHQHYAEQIFNFIKEKHHGKTV